MKQQTYNAALYCRLSKDDDMNGESMSISTQKRILSDFAHENGFNVFNTYIDDGYSGTNFDRPAFNKMLEDIEEGSINTVLTKDLSRLGRDYLQTGMYIEKYFPSHNIRYIAIGDNVDTEKDSPENDFILPFKNIFNEHYAREVSRKTKAALRAKAKNGEFLGSVPPYGYMKSPDDNHKLIIDEKTAPIVIRIFEMAANGYGYTKIANQFTKEKILKPTSYQNLINKHESDRKPYDWNLTSVRVILNNPVYLGNMAQSKKRKVSFKEDRVIKVPQNEWIVVENTHEPLVLKELWDNAHARLEVRNRETHTGETQLFAGLVKCSDCGKALSLSKYRMKQSKQDYLCCSTYKQKGKDACTIHFIRFEDLYDIVLNDIRRHAILISADENRIIKQLIAATGMHKDKELINVQKELDALKKRDMELDGVFIKIYDDKLKGILAESRFVAISKRYEQEQIDIKVKIGSLSEKLRASHETFQNVQLFTNLIREYTDIKALDKQILHQLVDKVVVSQKHMESGEMVQEVVINYKFIGRIS
jgi:site-specific DNA recombinase